MGEFRVVSKSVLAGALVCMMLGQPAQEQAQQSAPQQQPQQQIPDGPKPQIPDAPKPQTLPIGPVIPGRGTTVDSNGDSSTSDETATPQKLPETAAQKADEGKEPELPAAGEGPQAFTLVVRTNFVEIPFTVKDNKGRLVRGSRGARFGCMRTTCGSN